MSEQAKGPIETREHLLVALEHRRGDTRCPTCKEVLWKVSREPPLVTVEAFFLRQIERAAEHRPHPTDGPIIRAYCNRCGLMQSYLAQVLEIHD
jgi:hypothetical protein